MPRSICRGLTSWWQTTPSAEVERGNSGEMEPCAPKGRVPSSVTVINGFHTRGDLAGNAFGDMKCDTGS